MYSHYALIREYFLCFSIFYTNRNRMAKKNSEKKFRVRKVLRYIDINAVEQ